MRQHVFELHSLHLATVMVLTFFLCLPQYQEKHNCLCRLKNILELTRGTLYKPKTVEIAIVRVEEESPTIPKTGGFPSQVPSNEISFLCPFTKDNAAENPIARWMQLSYRLYPRVRLGRRLGFLLISSIAKAMV